MPDDSSILIIDDNEDMLVMLAIILRGKGYTVTARNTFIDLNTEIVTLDPRMVLIDKNLGWADGLDICRSIRAIPSLTKTIVIIFSAYALSVEECHEAGASGVFEKPSGMEKFLADIESCLTV